MFSDRHRRPARRGAGASGRSTTSISTTSTICSRWSRTQNQSQRKEAVSAARDDRRGAGRRVRPLAPNPSDGTHDRPAASALARHAREEVQRALQKLPNVSDSDKEHLADLARRIVNKLLHDPIEVLRQSDNPHVPMTQYIHAMEKLFKLDAEEKPPAKTRRRTPRRRIMR